MSWLNAHEYFLMEFAARDRLDDRKASMETANASTDDSHDTCDDYDGSFCAFALIPATKGGEAR